MLPSESYTFDELAALDAMLIVSTCGWHLNVDVCIKIPEEEQIIRELSGNRNASIQALMEEVRLGEREMVPLTKELYDELMT